MRRSILIAAGLLLPLAEALAGSWVIGGSIGSAKGDAGAGALNSQLAAQGLNATASSSDDDRMAKKLYLGYRYTANWGLEFGYVDLGQISTTFSGTVVDIDTFLTSVSDIHPQTAQGWQLSGSYRFALGTHSSLVVQAGVLDWSSKYELEAATTSRTVSSSGVSGLYGMGVERSLGDKTKLSFDYTRYTIDGEPISILGVGFSYRLN